MFQLWPVAAHRDARPAARVLVVQPLCEDAVKRRRAFHRLLRLADHAHQRTWALRELARVVGGTELDARLILNEYRQCGQRIWLERQERQIRRVA